MRDSTARLFAKYAVISLLPVAVLGFALAASMRSEANKRGLTEGRHEATLVAQTAVEPLLDGRPLSAGLSSESKRDLSRLVTGAVNTRDVLRLRVRDLAGRVVFSDDRSGMRSKPEDEALYAAGGHMVVRLTRLNTDTNDSGHAGKVAVEVYQPLRAGPRHLKVGVLELYLPYKPIGDEISASLHSLYIDLALGLSLLYLALFAITASVSRGLRRQVKVNAQQAERLRASEEHHRLLFERNPQSMLAYARDTQQIVAVSNAMVASYGYSRDELLGMTLRDLAPREGPSGDAPAGTSRDDHGLLVARPERHRYRDGTIIDVEVTSDDLLLDGRECRIAACENVTERNRAHAELAIARDQAVEASNMKSAFLANMSHEIRTPMNGVLGMNDLLLATKLDDEQRAFSDQVARSGEQMLALINDMLDISKIEAGRLELDPSDYELRTSLEQACAIAELQAAAKGLDFALRIADDVPRFVNGDDRRLRQVLLNLVSNAVKFTASGGVLVRVSATAAQADSTTVRCEVSDTGIGLEPQLLGRMFEPFVQADVSTTRRFGGTGLGLTIARELLELMGGRISGESEPGKGSTFWFELTLTTAARGAAAPIQAREAPETQLRVGPVAPLILVAEDSAVNQVVAVRALERCGARADVVGDGEAALEALASKRYDAVLMDCQMPGLDGYEATIRLRAREHGTGRHTVVIAMTAHAMEGDREKCLDAGMDDHISKPMRPQVLADVLRRWLAPETTGGSTPPGDPPHRAPVRGPVHARPRASVSNTAAP